MITLCMIVKNEELNLKKSLKAVSCFVDEMIIVDTGSSDKTKDVAKEFTDKVYDFKWCDDFAKARNFAVSKASNDWILVLDADEVIVDFDTDSILKFIEDKNNSKVVGRIKIINFLDFSSKNRTQTERLSRLFNKKYFHYEGMIHEQVTALDGESYSAVQVDITVNHFGYTKEVLSETSKLQRNIALLKKAVENNPKDSYYLYQLGKSYYLNKQYNIALINFKKALKFIDNFNYEYAEDLIETYGYCLINTNQYLEALYIEKYKAYYSKSPDYNFLMGLIYMNNGNFKEAINSFSVCTAYKEGKIEGINSYLPYYNIGVIYECLGIKDKSISYYKMCGSYEPALKRL
ncbi:glycosyltransferase [Clostridium sp. P21]|uniref:Glycosyltransferase n=2 Tax=Clostridium muellerianum TaxID=2716538 RepID=A0A7Y0ED73_9CLOT|nr:glycosyltransferase family 2 protein [Clostridium muellerianum]NMM61283.1 glycosyltransferase [Clostridium muellerianum]